MRESNRAFPFVTVENWINCPHSGLFFQLSYSDSNSLDPRHIANKFRTRLAGGDTIREARHVSLTDHLFCGVNNKQLVCQKRLDEREKTKNSLNALKHTFFLFAKKIAQN